MVSPPVSPRIELPNKKGNPASRPDRPAPDRVSSLADAVLVVFFLGLTFLLGVFPLNDTDFWWHLRTGDLIRQTGRWPRTDWYTFGAAGHPWIDLHWGFQVGLSWLYSLGGVDATNLAKCVVTTAAVAILLSSRRSSWPLWVMTLAWLPALLLLGGRMYVRPETMTLLYLAIDLAILFRIDLRPRLAWGLPIVQVFWVNTQGLFVLGPIVIGMALVDATTRRGAFSPERKAWWGTILAATLATGVACLANPYGIFGALFPLQLMETMGNPVFKGIMELMPIPDFIASVGLDNLPLQIHLATMGLGALSFLIPLVWKAAARVEDFRSDAPVPKRKKTRKQAESEEPRWRLSPFRLLLFAAFSLLSLRATRNSHQFAAVVGTVTAWNLGEWAAAVARRRAERSRDEPIRLLPRLGSTGIVAGVLAVVGSGQFYEWTGEGRTVGWGEKPLWFPHEAVKFAGGDGMPDRFLTFHNGHAGLFEYHNGPDRKVFADARLEVMGPQTYGQDVELGAAIAGERPGWSDQVRHLGPPIPGVLVDHVQVPSAAVAAALLGHPDWSCVYYDPIASVYLPGDATALPRAVDFRARHFGRSRDGDPQGADALRLAARALHYQAYSLIGRGHRADLAAGMIALGQGYTRRALALDRNSAASWKTLGQLESLREKRNRVEPFSQTRLPFDPVHDLDNVRATHDLLRADRLKPGDFATLYSLFELFFFREMNEAAAPVADRLIACARPKQMVMVENMATAIGRAKAAIRGKPSLSWSNRADLDRIVTSLLSEGRTETAANLLETAFGPAERTWEQADRLATLRLHLGRPDLARKVWREAAKVPRPAVRDARVAVTYLVEGDFDAARNAYASAIAAEPNLFEARYGLAILERDAGRGDEALAAALAAEASAGTDVAREVARRLAEFCRPYATAPPTPSQ